MQSDIANFDELMETIGGLGVWQWVSYACMSLVLIFQAAINTANIFFAYEQDHLCAVENNTVSARSGWTDAEIKNFMYPTTEDGSKHDGCHMFNRSLDYFAMTFVDANVSIASSNDSEPVACNNGWIYDQSIMQQTIVSDWHFVCGKEINIATAQSVYMAGILVGSLMAGSFSDFCGRKTSYIACGLLICIFGVAQSFAPTFAVFLALRFFLAFGMVGCWLTGFVHAQEITTARYRTWVGAFFWIFEFIGFWGVSGIAYASRNWRHVHIAISAPLAITLLFIWLLSESPRWLLVKYHTERARSVIERAAQWNRIKLPTNIDYEVIAEKMQREDNGRQSHSEGAGGAMDGAKDFFRELAKIFKHKLYCCRTLIIYFNWFVISMIYYGLLWNVGSLSGNIFINAIISGAVSLPGYLVTAVLLKWGRQKGWICAMVVAAVSFFASLPIPKSMPTLHLLCFCIGRIFTAAGFNIIYCYTAELFPTVVRNTIQGSGSLVARIGSIISPYIIIIPSLAAEGSAEKERLKMVPSIIFGIVSLLAAMVSILLPETKNVSLPDHMEDMTLHRSFLETKLFGGPSPSKIYSVSDRKSARSIDFDPSKEGITHM